MTKAEAHKHAARLHAFLKKKYPRVDWRVDTWDNMGWHYCIFAGTMPEGREIEHRGLIEIHERRYTFGKPDYTVYIQTYPQFIESGKELTKILEKQLWRANTYFLNGVSAVGYTINEMRLQQPRPKNVSKKRR
jgi:hypothetical protein